MNELPDGWESTTLGEIAAWGSGGTPSRSEPSYYGGGIPWIKTGELGPRFVSSTEESISAEGLSKSSAKLFPAGSVAIAMYGATIGKTSILGIPATTNQACAVGIPHVEATTKEYLYHFLCSQKEAFVEAGKGGAQPNISQAIIKDWKLPLAPLPEQKRISDKLDSVLARVDACRDRLDRLPTLLKRFRQSILAAATSGRLTEDWRDGVEQNWEQVHLGNIGEFGRGKSKHRPRNDPRLYGGPHPFVQTGDVTGSDGVIRRHTQNYSHFGLAQSKLWPAGTLCITIAANIADTAVLSYPACFPDSIVGFVANEAKCNVRFVKWVIDVTKEDLERFAPATAQKNINLGVLSEITFKLPSIEEQTEIVRRVDVLFAFADRLEARLAKARRQVGQLTPSLLAKAFRGELVPQDPADEPAAELLKRLAAQREAAPKAKRGRAKA